MPRLIRHGILSHMDHATREAFAALTQTVERGFAAVAEDIADIRARMATKDDIKDMVTAQVGRQRGSAKKFSRRRRRVPILSIG